MGACLSTCRAIPHDYEVNVYTIPSDEEILQRIPAVLDKIPLTPVNPGTDSFLAHYQSGKVLAAKVSALMPIADANPLVERARNFLCRYPKADIDLAIAEAFKTMVR